MWGASHFYSCLPRHARCERPQHLLSGVAFLGRHEILALGDPIRSEDFFAQLAKATPDPAILPAPARALGTASPVALCRYAHGVFGWSVEFVTADEPAKMHEPGQ